MAPPAPTKSSGPIAQKRKLPEPSNSERPKKFGRTSKGRKAARANGKKMRESEASSDDPQQEHEHPFFACLPPELHDEILSYLPKEDLASARRSCKKFHKAVIDFETSLAKPTVTFHLNRLQASIDQINDTKFPKDADSFLACLRTWTSLRGCFRNPKLSLASYNKWFSHLAGGRLVAKPGRPKKKFQRWARLAAIMTVLQRRVNELVNRKIDPISDEDELRLWDWFDEEILKHNCPMDTDEHLKLFNHIRDARDDERAIDGRWHTARKERSTFPHDKTEKMTHGDHARRKRQENARKKCTVPGVEGATPPRDQGRFRLTPILSRLEDKLEGLDGMRYPVRPAEIMCANLGLPALPDHNTFCYYVTEAWVFDKLSKSYPGAIKMGPSMRAAALACMEIF